jgi:hypothetical protein
MKGKVIERQFCLYFLRILPLKNERLYLQFGGYILRISRKERCRRNCRAAHWLSTAAAVPVFH